MKINGCQVIEFVDHRRYPNARRLRDVLREKGFEVDVDEDIHCTKVTIDGVVHTLTYGDWIITNFDRNNLVFKVHRPTPDEYFALAA